MFTWGEIAVMAIGWVLVVAVVTYTVNFGWEDDE